MTSFFDIQKYAATGIASADMTAFDKMRAIAAFGGGTVQTLTGQPPLSFKSGGSPLIAWSMLGNGQQSGTPSPDAPIVPEFVGKLYGTDWTIPITNDGQTTPVYLGQTQTVRRIYKIRLFNPVSTTQTKNGYRLVFPISEHPAVHNSVGGGFCNITTWDGDFNRIGFVVSTRNAYITQNMAEWATIESATAWLEENEVYIWYVLAEPEIGIANEPLAKIGDYADELSSTDSVVSIPTAKGQNTLTVDTELMPSEMTINYRE